MGKVPVLKPAEVVAILHRLGFVEVRQPRFSQTISRQRWALYNGSPPLGSRYLASAAAADCNGHRAHGRRIVKAPLNVGIASRETKVPIISCSGTSAVSGCRTAPVRRILASEQSVVESSVVVAARKEREATSGRVPEAGDMRSESDETASIWRRREGESRRRREHGDDRQAARQDRRREHTSKCAGPTASRC